MTGRRRVLLLMLVTTGVAVSVCLASLFFLYEVAFEVQRQRLQETLQIHARLVEAVARHEARLALVAKPGGPGSDPRERTLAQVRDAHSQFRGPGKTGQFVLARQEADRIVSLLETSHPGSGDQDPVPVTSPMVEPERRALAGKSGTVVGPDHRGAVVLAAYEPVRGVDWVVVARIDLAEVREPFVLAGLYCGLVALALLGIGSWVVVRVGFPMARTLEDAERRYRHLFETAGSAIIGLSPEGRIVEFNPAAQRILGASREAVLDQDFLTRFVLEPDREDVAADLDKVFAGESVQGVEHRVKGSEPSPPIVHWNITPLTGAGDDRCGALAAGQDITRRRRAEDRLLRLNRALRLLGECNHALVHARDEATLLSEICRKTTEVGGYRLAWVGYAEQDEARSVIPQAHAGVDDGYLAQVNITWADEERGRGPTGTAIRTGQVQVCHDIDSDPKYSPWRPEAARRHHRSSIALPLKDPDRTFGTLNIYATTPDAFDPEETALLAQLAGDLAYGIKALRAAVEREQAVAALGRSEQRLQLALAASNQGLYDVDLKTGQGILSPEYATMLGHDPATFVETADSLLERMHPDDRERIQAEIGPFLSGQVPGRSSEFRLRCKDGRYRWVLSVGRGFDHDAGGRPTRLIGTHVDITERRRLEQQLLQSQKMESVGRLAGGVAHDFNNILTVITGYTDLLLETVSRGDPARQCLEQIYRSAERGTNLTGQLLAFSRKQVLDLRVVDLNEVIRGVESMLGRVIGEDVEMVTTLAPDLAHVRADRGQLDQILMNLAVNARDAMPRGGKLSIETRNVVVGTPGQKGDSDIPPGSYVVFAVTDTGCGMDESVRCRLFEPFFTTKEVGKGTGLGLSTVYGIVKQSDGYLEVKSEPARGSTFSIYLPRVDEPVEAKTATSPPAPSFNGSGTILVAEDEECVRDLIRDVLREEGHTVLLASSGPEALKSSSAHQGPIDLLVTDMVMPGMDGNHLVKQFLAQRPGAAVLLVSGYSEEILGRHGDPGSATPLLPKPFHPQELVDRVRRLLSARGRVQ
ncbi:MAG: PAS domain S-box protein [Candidatus Riflebacteria bacterium]|nr:PAS domain S-box protein [Candidatus Riflebacteria bacterium]